MSIELILQTASPVLVALIASIFSFIAGRRKGSAEIENLKSEKKVSEAEAARVLAEAAAQIVSPLLERLRSLQEEVNSLTQINRQLKGRVEELEALVKTFLPKES